MAFSADILLSEEVSSSSQTLSTESMSFDAITTMAPLDPTLLPIIVTPNESNIPMLTTETDSSIDVSPNTMLNFPSISTINSSSTDLSTFTFSSPSNVTDENVTPLITTSILIVPPIINSQRSNQTTAKSTISSKTSITQKRNPTTVSAKSSVPQQRNATTVSPRTSVTQKRNVSTSTMSATQQRNSSRVSEKMTQKRNPTTLSARTWLTQRRNGTTALVQRPVTKQRNSSTIPVRTAKFQQSVSLATFTKSSSVTQSREIEIYDDMCTECNDKPPTTVKECSSKPGAFINL
jgi:hypothetical protein